MTKVKSYLQITNSNGQCDGTGAQVQRIISLAAYARFIRIKFAFYPISQIEIQHGDKFKSEGEVLEFLDKLNRFLSDIFVPMNGSEKKVSKYSREFYIKPNAFNLFFAIPIIGLFASLLKVNIRLFLSDAYAFTRIFPNSYLKIFEKYQIVGGLRSAQLDVQVHIRFSTISLQSDRHVPSAYYLEWLDFLREFASVNNFTIKLLIHTDCEVGEYNDVLITKYLTSETSAYWRAIGVTDENDNPKSSTITSYKALIEAIQIIYPDVVITNSLSPLSAWRIMSTSDIILTSKSSFSFVGALLAKSAIVISPDMEIKNPGCWIEGMPSSEHARQKFISSFMQKTNSISKMKTFRC